MTRRNILSFAILACAVLSVAMNTSAQTADNPSPPNTTVVDRRSGAESHVCGSGSEVHGIDVVFAIGTSAADAQRRAILARAGG